MNLVNSKVNAIKLSENRVNDIEKRFCDVHDIFVREDSKVSRMVDGMN